MSLADDLRDRLSRFDGLSLEPSRWHDEPAYWYRGMEILHFHGDSEVDLRLTRREIAANRASLREDARVRWRTSPSDWLTLNVGEQDDVQFVVELVKAAMKANHSRRQSRHVRPKPPRWARD